MRLHRADHGEGPPLTFVHGFTQTGESWNPVVDLISDGHRCCLVDAPGHGRSTDGTRSLRDCADDIFETMERSVLIGYSMGARMALTAAIHHAHGDKITGLVLVSGTTGLDDPIERQTRVDSDEALADRIETIGVPAFIDEWLAMPMFSGLTDETAQRHLRLTNTAKGLADSLRHAGTGTQTPASDSQLAEIDVPVLLVTGSLDQKFTNIAAALSRRFRDCTHVVVEGVGHTVHLEAPQRFTVVLEEWLSRVESGDQAD